MSATFGLKAGNSAQSPPPGSVTLDDLAPLAAFSVIGNETASSATPTAVKMNAVPGYATTATAAGSTTLTNVSKGVQRFSGATTQTVVLPVVTTLPQTGFGYWIVNDSTGAVTVNSSGGNAVQVVAANSRVWVFAILLTGTSAASWDVLYVPAAIAANITNTPAGSIAATTVQAAIDELDTSKVDGTAGVKVYRALLTQASTVAPSATVLENSLGGTLVWTRDAGGRYFGTLAGVFLANKVFASNGVITPDGDSVTGVYSIARTGNDTVKLISAAAADIANPVDDILSATPVQILVYP